MDDRIHFIKHKGQPILMVDCSHATAAQMLLLLEHLRITVAKHAHESVVTLADPSVVCGFLENRRRHEKFPAQGSPSPQDSDQQRVSGRYSVEAELSPWSADCAVCHASVAHLTRTGNSRTPAKTAGSRRISSKTGSAASRDAERHGFHESLNRKQSAFAEQGNELIDDRDERDQIYKREPSLEDQP